LSRFFLISFLQIIFTGCIFAQAPVDTTKPPISDSVITGTVISGNDTLHQDTMDVTGSNKPLPDSNFTLIDSDFYALQKISNQIIKYHPYFGFGSSLTNFQKPGIKKYEGKELLFYLLIFLIIIYALMQRAFPKYFNDLYRLFFKTTIKQIQVRDQLIQTPLPSLLLNVFFVLSGGLYISFLLQYFKLIQPDSFWKMFIYCSMGLSAAYFAKFIGLKFTGWLFNMQETADSYVFIVFIVNKMIGILLIPFLVILAFTEGNIYTVGLTLSWCLVAGLLAYRFILTYSAIHNQIKVNPFHFLLYLFAFEIAPLLLVYKALLHFFG